MAPLRSVAPAFDVARLSYGPPDATCLDWWRIPIGGGVSHVCPGCVDAVIGEHDDGSEYTGLDAVLDMGAWTVDPCDAGTCEVCDRAPTMSEIIASVRYDDLPADLREGLAAGIVSAADVADVVRRMIA